MRRYRGTGGEQDAAIDPHERPVAFAARWGLMALAAILLVTAIAWVVVVIAT